MNERSQRTEIKNSELEVALDDLKDRVLYAFEKHGRGIFENSFESIGVMTLEFEEFKRAVQEKEGTLSEFNEALDTAAVSLVTAISLGKKLESVGSKSFKTEATMNLLEAPFLQNCKDSGSIPKGFDFSKPFVKVDAFKCRGKWIDSALIQLKEEHADLIESNKGFMLLDMIHGEHPEVEYLCPLQGWDPSAFYHFDSFNLEGFFHYLVFDKEHIRGNFNEDHKDGH